MDKTGIVLTFDPPSSVKIGPHAANVSPDPTTSDRSSWSRSSLPIKELRRRTKRINQLKADLQSLKDELHARLTVRSKTEAYALFAGIEAHKQLLKLVYNIDLC